MRHHHSFLICTFCLVVGSQLSDAQVGEATRLSMNTERVLWRFLQNQAQVTPRVRVYLDWARNAGVEPRLMATAAGEQALIVPCRPSLEAFTASLSNEGQTALDRTGLDQRGDWLALLDLVSGPEAARLVWALAEGLENDGKALGVVGLPRAEREGDPPNLPGLEPIAMPP